MPRTEAHALARLPHHFKRWRGRTARQWANYTISIGLIVAGLFGALSVSAPFPQTSPTPQDQQSLHTSQAATLPRSLPTHLTIPDISVSTDLIQLGKNADGTLETPDRYDIAGWYKYSPTPGEMGPAVITGHVDNYLGPAVFFRLKELRPGQAIYITRADKSVATFKVDDLKTFEQSNFPTKEVYGNIDHAGLRLITCTGTYNPLSGHYSHNVVVYASLQKNQ